MNWQDVLIEKLFDKEVLRHALATAFGVPLSDVCVVESVDDAPSNVPVIAEETLVDGDFKWLISLYVSEAIKYKNEIEIARKLSSTLEVPILVPDKSTNPYIMILINNIQEMRLVLLDAESLDERNEYRLAKNEPKV